MSKFGYFMLLVFCAVSARSLFAEGISFPSTATNISPHKLWEIRSQRDNQHEGVYSLILRDRRTGAERRIFTGDRWCEVLWNANDTQIAITDWSGSNESDILLFGTGRQGEAKELADDAARAFLAKDELTGHCYWEALKWGSDDQLRIRAFGHTDWKSHEFVYEFIFDPVKKSATLVKKENDSSNRAEQKIWADKEKAFKRESRIP